MPTPTHPTQFTLEQLNSASAAQAHAMLADIYEHSPHIAQAAVDKRPFASIAQLKYTLAHIVSQSSPQAQLALICAHPELAGKAMQDNALTDHSNAEQNTVGLTHCTAQELAQLQSLNERYRTRFGFPFILAVRGPRGTGLSKQAIIQTFERRLQNPAEFERAEALRNIHRIAELRINDRFNAHPVLGNACWDGIEALAQYTDQPYEGTGQLTVTYLTQAHQKCAQHIQALMQSSGFDHVEIDAVGNVVGRYLSDDANAKTLLTGSHYDTVRNGGKYDGRLGIFVPITWIAQLAKAGKRLPFHVEVVAFAEEEGQRYKATFIGSSALTGSFSKAWLQLKDDNGMSMQDAMLAAGLNIQDIDKAKRDPSQYLGYVEVHIEQGPVLSNLNLPLGIVGSINGSVRFAASAKGMASHAGTTPMNSRLDAAAAAAQLLLYIEERAAQDETSVGTVGMLGVPNGSPNVIAAQCDFTIDLRAPNDAQRDQLASDVQAAAARISAARGVSFSLQGTMRASAAPSDSRLQGFWTQAVQALGLPAHAMPSGAGHDAMVLHTIMPQAMLFVRGENAGISHNPLESTTSDDMQLAIEAFAKVLEKMAAQA